jgi:hypothetical protein
MSEPQRGEARPVPSHNYLAAFDDLVASLKYQMHIDRETLDALLALEPTAEDRCELMVGLQAVGLIPDEWLQDVAEG